ncbi:MAG: HisA/HisF-related TIM barrel protein [Methanomassiliicoccales archaeon]
MAKDVKACPRCGSTKILPKMLFGGPLAGVDNKDYKYRCLDCGKEAVPISFSAPEERERFSREEPEAEEEDFVLVPMVPLNTEALLSMGGIEMPLGKVAEVVDVSWDGGFVPGEYRVPFLKYWRAISGNRYNAQRIMLLDLMGIGRGKPNFGALKELIKHRYEVWLDLGLRDVHDLFDSFAMDISWAVVNTLTCPWMDLYREMFELSDRCMPCVYFDDGVLWGDGGGPRDLSRTLKEFERIGFQEVSVLDLPRIGTSTGVSEWMLEELEGQEMRVYLGGGVTETALEEMRERGLAGAIMDPYTPVIRDLVAGNEEPESEAVSRPMPDLDRRPSPHGLPTDS